MVVSGFSLRWLCLKGICAILAPYQHRLFNHTSTILRPYFNHLLWSNYGVLKAPVLCIGRRRWLVGTGQYHSALPMRVWCCRHLITFLHFLPRKRASLVPGHGLLVRFCLVPVPEGKLLGALQGHPCG